MSEDKLYYVQYTGSEVVVLGKAGKFMPGTSAYLREADARAAASRGDFVVQGLDGAAASSKPVTAASSSPPVAASTAPASTPPSAAASTSAAPTPAKAEEKKAKDEDKKSVQTEEKKAKDEDKKSAAAAPVEDKK